MTLSPEDLQEIGNLINESTKIIKDDLLKKITEDNEITKQVTKGLSSTIEDKLKELSLNNQSNKIDSKDSKDSNKSDVDLKIETLRQELETERKKAFNSELQSTISKFSSDNKVTTPEIFKNQIISKYGQNIINDNGSYYLKENGTLTSLDNAMSGYLASDEGQFFKPATGIKGSGSKTSTDPKVQAQMDKDTAFVAAFQNF